MNSLLFTLCNGLALAGWVILITLPRWRWSTRIAVVIALLLSAGYLALGVAAYPWEGGFGSLEEVSTLFRNETLLLAGWIHYLAFDLLIGALQLRRAREAGMPHLLLIPSLILTFLAGPVGFLLFFIVKSSWQRRLEEVIA